MQGKSGSLLLLVSVVLVSEAQFFFSDVLIQFISIFSDIQALNVSN